MKKTHLIIATLVFLFHFSKAQTVHKGEQFIDDKAVYTYFYLDNQKDNEIEDDIQEYFKSIGNVKETKKHTVDIFGVKNTKINADLDHISILVDESGSLTKVSFLFFNSKNENLNNQDISAPNAQSLINNFQKYSYLKWQKKLSNINLKNTEKTLREVIGQKEKIEKQIESNLREQENLNKKLTASPEKMAQLESEKKRLESENNSSKNIDKSLAKAKKNENKAENKIKELENRLISLKNDLDSAKMKVKEVQRVFDHAKTENDTFQKN